MRNSFIYQWSPKKKHCLWCVVSAIVILIFTIHRMRPETFRVDTVPLSKDDYLIHTDGCVIPMLRPFPKNLQKLIKVEKHIECKEVPYPTYRDNYTIKVNSTALKNFFPFFGYCKYIPFTKKLDSDSSVEVLLDKAKNFTKEIVAKDAFVTVKCFNQSQHLVSTQQYAFILRNGTLDKILDARYNTAAKHRPMNVLVFGFESTSRLNFIRHMNMTYDFITHHADAIEMTGYNKIGLNTFPNMIPVFLGIPENEMNYSRGFLDNYPFIWKNFSAAGYRTFMIEDYPEIATFEYLKDGFRRAPFLHYLFTYMIELERTNRQGLCSGNRQMMEIMLDRITEFIEVYKDVPHFSYSMIGRQTHDDSDGLGVEDFPYIRMLKYSQSKGLLDNTVLIFLGDHGIRYGRLRNTHQGRLEENLPALFLVLPKWFRNEHKDLYENMKSNTRTLINNFDVHATLHDILNIGKGKVDYQYKGKYGISLFRKIPRTRTCADLKIPPNYCTCSSYISVNTSGSEVKNMSQYIVASINVLLKDVSDKCATLRLDKILSSEQRAPPEKLMDAKNTEISDYMLTIKVAPSNAIFEAEIRYDSSLKETHLLSEISRLDKYGSQSDCVKKHKNGIVLERYCFCNIGVA